MAIATEPVALDEAKLEAFMGKVVGDLSGATTSILCSIGDRLGLFKELAQNGPATSPELAERAAIHERYAREWLHGLHAAGYLEHDAEGGRFTLPPEHAQALAAESGPFFVGGMYQMLPRLLGPFDTLVDSFRTGGGVPQSAYHPELWEGMERFSATWIENHLVQTWLAAMPEARSKLERGARVADVGCGSGLALLKLAEAFPRSTFVGYDAFEGQLELARAHAAQADVGDRVAFRLLDAAAGLPERYDLIATFDVIHDAADPLGLLRSIREGLEPDGHYLMLEVNASGHVDEAVGPIASMFYGVSVLYCMTTSLAQAGAALGTCGMHEAKVRELCDAAGFSSVRRLPIEDPFNALFEARP